MQSIKFCAAVACIAPCCAHAGQALQTSDALPRSLTVVEAALLADDPLIAAGLDGYLQRGVPGSIPAGAVRCPGEYEPAEGILMAYEGQSGWKRILDQMAAAITTAGGANVYVICDSAGEQNTARSAMIAAGADGSRVFTYLRTTDSIWMRDYGPRYIYEGNGGANGDLGVRAIVDHTYNRPRPNDNLLPDFWASLRGETQYQIPLIHGGGNYHLSGAGDSFSTRLIANENPLLSDEDIVGLWREFQNLETELVTPFPSSVDATQHIDMWMQIIADDAVVIADWPLAPGSAQDLICDATASLLAGRGYSVTRVPNIGNPFQTHFTFTNVVMCNDIVLLPRYDSVAQTYNDQALSAWQAALPGKQIIQIDCDAIVSAAGVMHCIVMHVPANADGENPVVRVVEPAVGDLFEPGTLLPVTWRTDDDQKFAGGELVIDVLLSTNDGMTFAVVSTGETDDGEYLWTVPNIATAQGVLRVIARDADGNTGFDDTDENIIINGTDPACNVADLAGPFGVLDLGDVQAFVNGFVSGSSAVDLAEPIGVLDLADLQAFVGAFVGGCP